MRQRVNNVTVESTDHGIIRVMQRGRFLTWQNALRQIHRAWKHGRPADLDCCRYLLAGHIYLFFVGLVYIFKLESPQDVPLLITALYPTGVDDSRLRAA